VSSAFAPFNSLHNPAFARLYLSQTTSLLGDALTWVGLALLAFELAGSNSSVILGAALTLRVTAFVILSPLAGALADRLDRKAILVISDLGRMVVIGLMPFVTQAWQVYVLMFALNALTAFFTPTYQATIPLVTGKEDYGQAISLSGATFEILGVLGPGIAGGVAALIGARSIFFLDAVTFLISAVLILTLPQSLNAARNPAETSSATTWRDVRDGTVRLWTDSLMRYALLLELVASVAGALVLVNTVGLVRGPLLRGGLGLGNLEYGWVMAAFGVGATLAALAAGALEKRLPRTRFVLLGAVVTTLAVFPANFMPFAPLLALWLVAGAGQNWVNLPTQTLIADRTPMDAQGRVYGAHFAWSHLWWALAYPLAGWLGSSLINRGFLYGGLVGLIVLVLVQLFLAPGQAELERTA
jgi:MFS transporter, NRE family, putaive nickel resistance protein